MAEAREQTGLPIVTEAMSSELVPVVAEYADVLQVGARNMQNFPLLNACGASQQTVLLKRGMSCTLEDLLMAAEYILSHGNSRVILCERGIRTFETMTRNTFDLGAIPALQQMTHLPVVADPSHAMGKWEYVEAVARGAVAAGADGLAAGSAPATGESLLRWPPEPDAEALSRADGERAAGGHSGRAQGLIAGARDGHGGGGIVMSDSQAGSGSVLRARGAGAALRGRATVPGDKSLSHRALLLGMLAAGETRIRGWLAAGDTEATLCACRALGVPIERGDGEIRLRGGELRAPQEALNLRHAGHRFSLVGGHPGRAALHQHARWQRAAAPSADATHHRARCKRWAPISTRREVSRRCASNPRACMASITACPVASAQVKSAILLAGLFAHGATAIEEPQATRDHSERMLRAMGADLAREGGTVVLQPGRELRPLDLRVPGDFSSAAFPLVAATLLPGSDITLSGVNLNPTRTGLLEALEGMGAKITVKVTGEEAGEPVGELRVRAAPLRGIEGWAARSSRG